MATYLKSLIEKESRHFTVTDPYITATRKNGLEIITIVNKTIKITNMEEPFTYDLSTSLSFDPTRIVLNECEELMCLYNESLCEIVCLKPVGTKVTVTSVIKVDIDLTKNERIIEIIFNNISKFQSEIVVLTDKKIDCYDINESTSQPVQSYPFTDDSKNSAFINNDFDSSIIDPVSITFEKSSESKGDLTLLLLTADASLYCVYPFFPNQMSVSKAWLESLANYHSLLFKMSETVQLQTNLARSFKVSAFLQQTNGEFYIKSTLPEKYRKGKITGPLAIRPFPDELYGFDAVKILALKSEVLAIVFNHCVTTITFEHSGVMVFEGQKYEPNEFDQLLMIEAQVLDEKYGEIITSESHFSEVSLLLTCKTNDIYSLIQIDYSKWINKLGFEGEPDDIDEFGAMAEKGTLPTSVMILGNIYTSATNNINHQLWFVWDSKSSYAITIDPKDIKSCILISLNDAEDDNFQLIEANKDATQIKKYISYIRGNAIDTFLPAIQEMKQVLSDIKTRMSNVSPASLDINTATAQDLKLVMEGAELTNKAQITLFNTLSVISTRLHDMWLEYQQQINTLFKIRSKKKLMLQAIIHSKTRYIKLLQTQKELQERIGKINGNVGKASHYSRGGILAISYQERQYFNELKVIDEFVNKKLAEVENVKDLLKQVEEAELSAVMKSNTDFFDDFQNRKIINLFKQNLEEKGHFIDYLKDSLAAMKI